MMKWKMYSVFDSAAGIYDRPFVAHNHGSATRSFGDIALNAEHVIGQHPEHFSLYFIGEFDDNEGTIGAVDRICIATAEELVSQARNIESGKLEKFDKKLQEVN